MPRPLKKVAKSVAKFNKLFQLIHRPGRPNFANCLESVVSKIPVGPQNYKSEIVSSEKSMYIVTFNFSPSL